MLADPDYAFMHACRRDTKNYKNYLALSRVSEKNIVKTRVMKKINLHR